MVSQVLVDKAMAEVIGETPTDLNDDEERPLFEGRQGWPCCHWHRFSSRLTRQLISN
jgi:hypothetical protein